MSHEIRTPMNAMIGLTYLLGQTSLNADQTGLLAQINVASKLLLAVITDVLDISKIEAGELMISRVAFSPRELLHGLHAIMHAQAESKGITLVLDVPDNLPGWLEGDAARLNQILANLLSNAIKFTERGGVTLCVRVLDISSKGSKLSFAVRDTGIGIDPAAQARLFTPFIQADESITRRYGGTGLGLSIIHSLAKLMGGTVDFTSAVAAGSEYRVVLDFALATSESLAVAQPASLGERPVSGVRVLVVDDYELNLVVTRRILEQAGAVVWVANTGQEALRALQLQSDQFDVVLMDVQMPIMDGYEATRRIRADLGLRELPIIALTAGALFSERQRATAVGMDDFISKPFDAATLISSVMQHTVSARVRKEGVRSAPRVMKERVDWPEIEGIDMEDARKRLCDDPALFRSLLRRFLEDFSDMAILSSRSGPVELEQLGCRLHKLRGAAGVLGAKAIQGLAAGAEAACVAGDAAGSEELLIALAMHMDALRERVTRARIETPCKEDRGADSVGLCRVLLVDDDHIVRAHVANLLERAGYRIGEAASGDEALRTLRGGDYQIVITDWKMPGMSGIELCHALRVGIDSRDLRVIMLTMSDAQQDADLCREAGADAYILKSAPNEEIIACVDAARNSVLGLV